MTNSRRITWFMVACLIGLLLSCSESSKVRRHNNKVELYGKEWEKLHPCVNDTVSTVTEGRTDTYITSTTDTVYQSDTVNTSTAIKVPYKVVVTKTVTVNRVDTLKVVVVDKRREQILQDEGRLKDGQIIQLTQQVSSSRHLATVRLWWIIGLIAAGVARMFIKYKYKIAWL